MKAAIMNTELERGEEKKQPRVRPTFHQRFNTPFGIEEAQQQFINRVSNILPSYIDAVKRSGGTSVLWRLANRLGMSFNNDDNYKQYLLSDFYSCLETLEATYEVLPDNLKSAFTKEVERVVSASEVDLRIQWRNGTFWPSGAKLLDQALVNENLKWLSDSKYTDVLAPFEKGLRAYLQSNKHSERLVDTVRDMYVALEKMATIICDNNKNLKANAEHFVSKLGLSSRYTKLLKDFTEYAHEFRHSVVEGKKTELPTSHEVEAFIYTSGLLIRLAIQKSEAGR